MKALLVQSKSFYNDVYHHIHKFYFKKIAIISENYPLVSNLSVLENITLPASFHNKLKTDHYIEMVRSDLKTLGFEQKIHSRKNELSDFEKFCVRVLQGLYSQFKYMVIFGEVNRYTPDTLDIFLNFLGKERGENILFIDYNGVKSIFESKGVKIIQKVEEWGIQGLEE